MALFELVAVDTGKPAAQRERSVPSAAEDTQQLHTDMQTLLRGQQQMMSVLIAQQAQIEKLNQALTTMRISRAQENALKDAIKHRAQQLAERESMDKGAERRIAGAIRVTIRETTGARAIGDLAAGQYDRTLQMVAGWYMTGALRKIRREKGM